MTMTTITIIIIVIYIGMIIVGSIMFSRISIITMYICFFVGGNGSSSICCRVVRVIHGCRTYA